MIILEGVTTAAGAGAKKRHVLKDAQAVLPLNHRIAVFGSVDEDKQVFMDLLGGLVLPSAGRIITQARISFPAGHLGGFVPGLSVRLNVAHVARLYGAEVDAVVRFMAQLSSLEKKFDKPYRRLEPAERRYLSEILAFSIPFDVYLLDDSILRPTPRFNRDARTLFEARAKTSGMIVASGDLNFAREFCDMGLVLHNGHVRLFKRIERAIAFLEQAQESNREERKNRRMLKRKKLRKREISGTRKSR